MADPFKMAVLLSLRRLVIGPVLSSRRLCAVEEAFLRKICRVELTPSLALCDNLRISPTDLLPVEGSLAEVEAWAG